MGNYLNKEFNLYNLTYLVVRSTINQLSNFFLDDKDIDHAHKESDKIEQR